MRENPLFLRGFFFCFSKVKTINIYVTKIRQVTQHNRRTKPCNTTVIKKTRS